jgi:hypothetical protein
VSVPRAAAISGGAIEENGSIVLWTRESNLLWTASSKASEAWPIELRLGTDVVAAAWVRGRLHIVDGGRRQILELDADGALFRATDVTVPIRIHAAARTRSGWVIGGSGVDGEAIVAAQQHDGFSALEIPRPDLPEVLGPNTGLTMSRSVAAGESFHLTTHGSDAVLMSWLQRPHNLAVLPLRGAPRWQPPIPSANLALMRASETGWNHWTALPAVTVAGGIILQTLTDLGSTGRAVLVRAADGTVVRMTTVDTPTGIVAASPSGRMVLAVTRVPTPAAICYTVASAHAGTN